MENKLFIIKKNINRFREGDIVKSFINQKYKNKTLITNFKVIGKWPCCGCNRYNVEYVENKYLEFLDNE